MKLAIPNYFRKGQQMCSANWIQWEFSGNYFLEIDQWVIQWYYDEGKRKQVANKIFYLFGEEKTRSRHVDTTLITPRFLHKTTSYYKYFLTSSAGISLLICRSSLENVNADSWNMSITVRLEATSPNPTHKGQAPTCKNVSPFPNPWPEVVSYWRFVGSMGF